MQKFSINLLVRDGKEPSLLGFSFVRILPKVGFGSVRVLLCKHGKFGFGSGSVLVVSVLSSVLYGFRHLTVLTLCRNI